MSDAVTHVNDSNFDTEVLQSSVPVLVDFWAAWCGPCRAIAPLLDELAASYAGKLKIVKVNVDENKQTPTKYGVRGIPTLLLFKNGNLEGTQVGLATKAQLAAFVDSYL